MSILIYRLHMLDSTPQLYLAVGYKLQM